MTVFYQLIILLTYKSMYIVTMKLEILDSDPDQAKQSGSRTVLRRANDESGSGKLALCEISHCQISTLKLRHWQTGTQTWPQLKINVIQ